MREWKGSVGNSKFGLADSTLTLTITGARVLGRAPVFFGAPDWGRTVGLRPHLSDSALGAVLPLASGSRRWAPPRRFDATSSGVSDDGLADSTLALINTGALLLGRAPVFFGAPDWGRTSDLCLRRAALYPAELRVRYVFMMTLLLWVMQPCALAALLHLSDSPPDCPPALRSAQSRR